jgi:phytoene dehydrogenase-like protein
MKTIIIGSGMSGLTAGAYLAQAGHDITIFEQFSEPGGVTASTKREGYGWDNGPLILEGFGPGDKGMAILEELGVSEQVKTLHEDRGLAFPDFAMWKPAEYEGPYWRKQRLGQLYPEERQNLERYYHFYDQMIQLMSLARQAETATGLSALWLKARMALAFRQVKDKVDWNAQQLMDDYFQREELKAFFTGIVADYVTKPSEFPALGVPSIHLETAFDKRIPVFPGTRSAQFGYYYLIGGCQSLVDAVFGAFTARGGRMVTNAAVQKIVVEENHVKGVDLAGGRFVLADLVIATGGARETFYGLVGREKLPAELCVSLDKIVFMESVLMIHLGIDVDPTTYQPAALCYYYGTYDLEGSIDRIRAGNYHEGKDGFLIYVPSIHSPKLAPPDRFAVTVYTVAPDRLREGSWAERREELADKLVAEAERVVPGLRQHTLVREILTPDDFRKRTHQQHHSFGGVPPVIGNKAPAHRTLVDGLWFIGSQSESGGGVMNVMIGAQKTAKRILAEAH